MGPHPPEIRKRRRTGSVLADGLFVAVLVIVTAAVFLVFKEWSMVWGMLFGRLPYRDLNRYPTVTFADVDCSYDYVSQASDTGFPVDAMYCYR